MTVLHVSHSWLEPVHESAMTPHCQVGGRSAAHVFGWQQLPLLQICVPPQGQSVLQAGSAAQVQVLPTQGLVEGHEHVLALPQLSVTGAQLFAPHAGVLALWQVPVLQHLPEPQAPAPQVFGAWVTSGETVASAGLHMVWLTVPLQSLPHAAGGVQQCAPLTATPPEVFGVFVPPGQPQVIIWQPLFQFVR